MGGRIKRKQAERALAEWTARAQERGQTICALCARPLGDRVEWHHRVPKSKGGVETVPVHPICHRAIHAHVSNHDLADAYADLDELRGRDDVQRFLRWVETKPPNFSAPTRRRRE